MSFDINGCQETAVVVHSLASGSAGPERYQFQVGEGLYTDMNAIRRDEALDALHSAYVDQWDWEKIISKEDRNMDTLKQVVQEVYQALKKTEKYMAIEYDYIEEILPKNIFFITSQELEDMYPDCPPKEREYKITKLRALSLSCRSATS